jgi:hypothetical protein
MVPVVFGLFFADVDVAFFVEEKNLAMENQVQTKDQYSLKHELSSYRVPVF